MMKKDKTGLGNGLLSPWIGEPTKAKASGLTYSLATMGATVVAFLFLTVLFITGIALEDGIEKQDWYLYCSYLINPISFALIFFFVLRWLKTPVREEICAQKCAPKYFLIAVLMQFGLLSLSELNTLFLSFLASFGYESTPILLPSLDGFGYVGVLVVVALLPAIFEEIIFRGLLLKGLRPFGTLGMILISGALFSLYHQNPAQTIYQFCCGAAFAFVAVKSGSFLPTVLSHFLNNALIITLAKFGVNQFPMPVYIILLGLEIVSLIAAMVWLFLDKKGGKSSIDELNAASEEKEEKKNFWAFASVGIFICVLSWLSVLLAGM